MSTNLVIFVLWQLTGDVIMVSRGHCKFTTKANIAQAAGASAVLIINNQRGKQHMIIVLEDVALPLLKRFHFKTT